MPDYPVPQVQIFQEFLAIPSEITEPLRAIIIAPNYQLVRFGESDEKAGGQLGDYDPDVLADLYDWPNLQSGAIVDLAFAKLWIEDALLRYFSDVVGDAGGDTIINVSGSKNKIEFSSVNLADYVDAAGSIYPRNAALLRDVHPGDYARVTRGNATVLSQILALENRQTDSSIENPAESDSENGNTQSASVTSWNQTAGERNLVRIEVAEAGTYDGRAIGLLDETYTVEVTQASVGGDITTARLRITSASGLDDVAGYSPPEGSDFDQPIDIGTRGLQVIFTNGSGGGYGYGTGGDDFVVGQTWEIPVHQAYTELVPAFSGTYTGPSDTTYILEITRGGALGVAQVTCHTTTGIDSSGPHLLAGTAITIGRYGLSFSLGAATSFRLGDKFYLDATASKDAEVRILVLSRNLPEDLLYTDGGSGDDLNVELYMQRTIEFPYCIDGATQYTLSAAGIQVETNAEAYDPEWVDDNGIEVALPIVSGKLYAHYRALLQTLVNSVGSLADVSDIAGTTGKIDVDNPLSMGLFKALQNSGGAEVRYIAVATDDFSGYSGAVEKLVGRMDVYSFVPLTFDRDVLNLIQGHIATMSSAEHGRWRIAWFGIQDIPDQQIGSDALATIKAVPGGSSTQYLYVEASGATFRTDGTRAGDRLRAGFLSDTCGRSTYHDYVIAEVVNNETLVLAAGPDTAVNLASKVQIWRTLNADEQAQAIATYAGTWGDRRIRAVWPDKALSGGVELASYYVAAAWAGLRSGSAPQQGLTNAALAGFDDVRVDLFNAAQLNVMALSGVWITTQDPNTGGIYCRHQLTTAGYGDTNNDDSVVTNVDSISYYFLNQLKPFIGSANLTDQTLALIETQIDSIIAFLKTSRSSPLIGGQLISGTIASLARDPVFRDKVDVVLDLDVPRAINHIAVTLRI